MPRQENQHEFEAAKVEKIKEANQYLETLKTDKKRIEWIARDVLVCWDQYSAVPSSATLEGKYEAAYIVYQHELVRNVSITA